jgi:hypothetical protein
MSKAFYTWNEDISVRGPLMEPLEPNGPPSNAELFARLNHMKSFRRFRALCEAIGFKPPDGASEAKVAAWWLGFSEMPEDFHDKLWQLFADHIEGRRQLWANFQQVLSVNATLSTKTASWIEKWSRRTNDLIACQALKVKKLEDMAESLARRVRPCRRKRGGESIRPLTPKQAEALHTLGECAGNYAKAARRIGIDRKSFEERCKAAYGKLGRKGTKRHEMEINKALVAKLPRDGRGQEVVATHDDGPAALENRKPRKVTRNRRG